MKVFMMKTLLIDQLVTCKGMNRKDWVNLERRARVYDTLAFDGELLKNGE